MRSLCLATLCCASLLLDPAPAGTRMKFEDLPAPVQQGAHPYMAQGTLLDVSREEENGRTEYEVKVQVEGRFREIILEASGKVVALEDEVALDRVPGAARAAIRKQIGAGRLIRVEAISRGDSQRPFAFEAIVERSEAKREKIKVKRDGSVLK